MTAFTIDEIAIPETIDGPGGHDFARAIEVGNAVEELGYGTADLSYEPHEVLPWFRDPHQPHRMLVARVDGLIVARAVHETQVGEQSDAAWVLVEVLPDYRRLGIGTALSAAVEAMAREEGRAKALVYTPIPAGPGETLAPPTGFGAIPASDPSVRFLLARGYRLEQIERASRLPLPVSGLDALVAAATERSGADYRVHTWTGSVPEQWLADYATLSTRMSTDAPSAGLEHPEDVWTIERVREADERSRLSDRTRVNAVVEHIPTGRLAGFTQLSVPRQLPRAVDQYATLVLREHRGHGLGLLLKVANLAHLDRVAPGHPAVTTFNAEENRHMLDVNEAVGFVPIASESAWRKDV